MERRKVGMICDNCYHRFNCEEIPDKKGRCSNYLKDGEIFFSKEMKFNPSDTIVYDYDLIRRIFDMNSSDSC